LRPRRCGVRAVDLVDDEDHRQLRVERLAQHEARLRERALTGVDEEQDAVDHRQTAFDLTAEVGVAGRVDDVELDVAVAYGGVLGEDRDAFSRSRSIESITRVATSWFLRNAPDCQSMASTSVVLPWSTWATIATLRMSLRSMSTTDEPRRSLPPPPARRI